MAGMYSLMQQKELAHMVRHISLVTAQMWVMEPDMSTVKTAVELMNKIKDGEVFDMDEYLESK